MESKIGSGIDWRRKICGFTVAFFDFENGHLAFGYSILVNYRLISCPGKLGRIQIIMLVSAISARKMLFDWLNGLLAIPGPSNGVLPVHFQRLAKLAPYHRGKLE